VMGIPKWEWLNGLQGEAFVRWPFCQSELARRNGRARNWL